MKWAASATKHAWGQDSGTTIPVPWRVLDNVIAPKVKNTGIVIAAPSVGKTTFLLNWVTQARIRALYISSDTTEHDLTTQIGALSQGHLRSEVEQRLRSSETWRDLYATRIAELYPNLVLDFTPSPTMGSIEQKVRGLVELWARPPQMVIQDTASNVDMEDKGDNAEWQRVWLSAKQIARQYGLFWCFAHHVKQGPAKDGDRAPVMSDGLWGSHQFAEYVLTLHNPNPRSMVVTVRKNRMGKRDVAVPLRAEWERALIHDQPEDD